MSIFFKLNIKEVRQETKDAVSIAFEIPENLQEQFKFIPGQYVTLRQVIDGEEVRRAYSICSLPNHEEFRIAVKAVEKGRFSVYANTKLKAGDDIEVAAPEGKFTIETRVDQSKNYIAFVAGSGITPVLSMLKSVLQNEQYSKFVLVYGNKSYNDTIFKDELDALVVANKDRLAIHYVYSQKISDQALFGRIDERIYNEIIKHKYHNQQFDEYLLCGPEPMIVSLKEILIKEHISEDAIKFELFTSSIEAPTLEEDLSGNTTMTVLLDDEETVVEMRKDELVLDAVLANGLDAPYSCQGGICSSCMAKVVEGQAVMEKNTILNEEEVAEGLILTCQAHPTTPTLKVDYDDV